MYFNIVGVKKFTQHMRGPKITDHLRSLDTTAGTKPE